MRHGQGLPPFHGRPRCAKASHDERTVRSHIRHQVVPVARAPCRVHPLDRAVQVVTHQEYVVVVVRPRLRRPGSTAAGQKSSISRRKTFGATCDNDPRRVHGHGGHVLITRPCDRVRPKETARGVVCGQEYVCATAGNRGKDGCNTSGTEELGCSRERADHVHGTVFADGHAGCFIFTTVTDLGLPQHYTRIVVLHKEALVGLREGQPRR